MVNYPLQIENVLKTHKLPKKSRELLAEFNIWKKSQEHALEGRARYLQTLKMVALVTGWNLAPETLTEKHLLTWAKSLLTKADGRTPTKPNTRNYRKTVLQAYLKWVYNAEPSGMPLFVLH